MKQVLFILAMCVSLCAHAQKYKDSLYAEYTKAYWTDRMDEFKYTSSLFRAAEKTFSVKNPVMRYAIKESKLGDSAAIAILGWETMGCFLDDKFLKWAGEHYEPEMLPILEIYNEELCGRITNKMKGYRSPGKDEMAKKLEQVVSECSIEAAKSQAFIAKIAKLREEKGQEEIIHAVNNLNQYMYVHCMYMRKYIMKACIDFAMEEHKAFKKEEEDQMLRKLLNHATGEPAKEPHDLDGVFLTKPESVEAERFLHSMKTNTTKLHGDSRLINYYTLTDKNKRRIIYYFDNGIPGQAKILGEIKGEISWNGLHIHLTKSKRIPAEKIIDKIALLKGIPAFEAEPEKVMLGQ